jgi:hypothetical protein
MRLTIKTSLPPNLLAHIYASAGVITNHEYQERHQQTLRRRHVEFLHSLKPYMAGEPPMGGTLYLYLFQYPSYFPTEDAQELLGAFDVFLRQSDPESLCLTATSGRAEKGHIETWIPSELSRASPESNRLILGELHRVIPELKKVIAEVHKGFYRDHWRENKPELMNKARDIQGRFDDVEVFEAWCDALRLDFPYPEFRVYVVEALGGGTSLMAEKFALPYGVSMERAVDTIIHEVGVHHIINNKEYLRRGLSPASFLMNADRIGRMEEAATCYFKPAVYERLGLALGEDYHIPLMGIGKEIEEFRRVWETGDPGDAIEALLMACGLA